MVKLHSPETLPHEEHIHKLSLVQWHKGLATMFSACKTCVYSQMKIWQIFLFLYRCYRAKDFTMPAIDTYFNAVRWKSEKYSSKCRYRTLENAFGFKVTNWSQTCWDTTISCRVTEFRSLGRRQKECKVIVKLRVHALRESRAWRAVKPEL